MTIGNSDLKVIIREAHKEFAEIQAHVQSWNEMADECQRQGYRPKYCIHGTYTWTDYDNICGGCEDGIYPQDTTYMDVLKSTLDEYRRTMSRLQERGKHLMNATRELQSAGLSDMIPDLVMKSLDHMRGRFTY